MNQKTQTEMEKARLLKAVRSTIRLKHSLNADSEINHLLPKIERDFDLAIASGKGYELTTSSLLLAVENDDEADH